MLKWSLMALAVLSLAACGDDGGSEGTGGGTAGGSAKTGGGSGTGGSAGTGGGAEAGGGAGTGGGQSTDTTPPTVESTAPADGATDVSASSDLTVTFSEPMDKASVTVASSPGISFGSASWSMGDTQLNLAPMTPWADDTTYQITVTGADLAGNAMTSPLVFSFTTASPQYVTPPTLVSSTPSGGATNVALTSALTLTFSEAMDTASVVVATTPASTLGAPTWSNGDKTVQLAPTGGWAGDTFYTVDVMGADLAGNTMSTSFAFTSATPPDTTPPTVQSTTPSSGATGVPYSTTIQFVFSEPMNTASIQGAISFSPAVTCTWSWIADLLLTCTPSAQLAPSTQYTATVDSVVSDKAGNAMAAPFVLTFTTAAAPDTTAPTILSTTPSTTPGALATPGAPRLGRTIKVTFSEPMNKASAQQAFNISSPTGLMGGSFTWNTAGTEMTYTYPSGATVTPGSTITYTVNNVATDLAGNELASASTGIRRFRLRGLGVVNLYSCGACVPSAYGQACTMNCTATVPDGHVNASPANCQGTLNATQGATASMGFIGTNYYRSFFNFNMAATQLASRINVSINRASLYVYQTGCGGSPYGTCPSGDLSCILNPPRDKVANVFGVDYGTDLTAIDCLAQESTGYATLPTMSTTAGWHSGSVLNLFQEMWTNRGTRGNRAQFLLRTYSFTGSGINYCSFATSTNSTATNRPYLAVEYEYD